MFVDVHGRKVFSFGCWGTRGWLETVDEMPQGMGTGEETKVRLQVTGLQNFCPASPFLSLLGKKKNPLSLKTHYSSIGLLEKKREGGEGLIW